MALTSTSPEVNAVSAVFTNVVGVLCFATTRSG